MEEKCDRYFGLCKCCLQDGCFKSMWADYLDDGEVLNFGEMLKECFALNWQKPDNELLEQICDDCIKHTRNTYLFRIKVLTSQAQLTGDVQIVKTEMTKNAKTTHKLDGDTRISVKQEIKTDCDQDDPDYQNNHDHQASPDDANISEYNHDSDAEHVNETEYISYPNDHDYTEECVDDLQFEDVQYLEVELDNGQGDMETQIQSDLNDHSQPTQSKKRIWPKKKRGERSSYKKYTLEDLKNSVAAARSGLMSPAAAGQRYNVPRKTIAARLLAERRGDVPTPETVRSRYHSLIEEVETLLTYTNATPFKTRTTRYHCAYCSTAGPAFEDADQLRVHTRTQHAGERTKGVERFLRPLWLNEVLKVDIDNLHCSVCCVVLVSWNGMFKHLREQHEVTLDEAYTRVIPFVLSRELRCALCKDSFPNFHHLDGHMNAHYNNYMCSDCGDTFVSEARLKKHVKIHMTGRFPCECGKTFTLEKYRKKHIELVHKQEENIKCLYCAERFIGTYPRHLHVLRRHREKVNFITCELCGKVFDWRPYYLVHVRKQHNNEKKYKCKVCEAHFFMKSELTRHMDTHTGDNK